jgi:hypothetical protein
VDQAVEVTEVDSGCFALALLRGKGAVEELNPRMEFAAGIGEDSDDIWVLRARISVKEAV